MGQPRMVSGPMGSGTGMAEVDMQFAMRDRAWYCGLVATMPAGHCRRESVRVPLGRVGNLEASGLSPRPPAAPGPVPAPGVQPGGRPPAEGLEGASRFGPLLAARARRRLRSVLRVNMPMREENEAERIPLLASAIPALEHVTNVMADSNAAKIEALHNLCPQLAHLANVLAEEREKQEKGLNKLAADESLERRSRNLQRNNATSSMRLTLSAN